MRQDLHSSEKQSSLLTESGGFAVPGSLHDLLDRHGVDPGADSRLRFRRKPAEATTVTSAVLAGSGLCHGVAMAFAGGWQQLPTGVAVLMGVGMTIVGLRLSRMAQDHTAIEIVASLIACVGMAVACAAVPEGLVFGINLQRAMPFAFLATSLVVVAAGFINRQGLLGAWSRTAAPVAVLAATLAAMD